MKSRRQISLSLSLSLPLSAAPTYLLYTSITQNPEPEASPPLCNPHNSPNPACLGQRCPRAATGSSPHRPNPQLARGKQTSKSCQVGLSCRAHNLLFHPQNGLCLTTEVTQPPKQLALNRAPHGFPLSLVTSSTQRRPSAPHPALSPPTHSVPSPQNLESPQKLHQSPSVCPPNTPRPSPRPEPYVEITPGL